MSSAPAIYKEVFYYMVNTIISIPGYVHLYRSLLRFYDMPENEVKEMLYLLNTANLDCRPYRTEIQLYKSLLFLLRSIDRELIITSQREALHYFQSGVPFL